MKARSPATPLRRTDHPLRNVITAAARAVRAARFPAALAAVLILLPLALPYEALATQILVYALFSLGFDLVYGQTGLLSFGHAAFFGIGAYAAGLVGRATQGDLLFGCAVAVVSAGAGAAVIGAFSLRRRGVYFALLTLAFAELLYFVALQWRTLTGGDNGLRGVPTMVLRLGGAVAVDVGSSGAVYALAACLVWLVFLGVRRLHESPFGHALVAVRENELRAEACGYNTAAVKLWVFVLSGGLCGLAGALNTLLLHFVGLDVLSWLTSGFVVLMTILGGAGTLIGPLAGAAVFLALQDVVSAIPALADSWPLFVGVLFIAAVWLFPEGLWGAVLRHARWPARWVEGPSVAEDLPPETAGGERPGRPSHGAAGAFGGAAVRLEGLTRRFGALAAVDGVSLEIRPGEVRGLIGPNGAGKSTLLRLICGELAPTSGRIYMEAREITGWPLFRVVRAGIVKSFQITSIFPNLSAVENVRVAVLARHNPYAFWRRVNDVRDVTRLADDALRRVHLAEKRSHPAHALSHGDQRHLEIAVALAASPRMLLLDEPTAGMSADETRNTMALIRELARDLTIVVVEHKMDVIMTLCDRVTVMHAGRVIADGAPAEVSAMERVQTVYLGRG